MSAHRPALVVVVSDLHAGSTLGLLPPDPTSIDSAIEVRQPQRGALEWMWAQWVKFTREAKRAALRRRVYVVVNGDAIDGKPHGSAQVVTDNPIIQQRIARACLAPLVELADRVFITRGTAAHTGQMGQHEEAIAEWLTMHDGEKAVRGTGGPFSWWELHAELGGVLMDFTHHCSAGARPWSAGNAATRIASELVQEYADRGQRIPRLAFRSHVHRYHDSYNNVRSCRVIITPAWQLRTEYGYRIAARPADVGGVLVTTDGAQLEDVRVCLYEPERVPVWRDHDEA